MSTEKADPSNTKLISSLVQMGYEKARVEEVVHTLDTSMSLEAKTIEAIKQLSK
jgi:Holliday junction resolvasome RuvABC DNA-binding subunit